MLRKLTNNKYRFASIVSALSIIVGAQTIAVNKAEAGGTLRVGMTAADIPLSYGQPDNGFEGFRFMVPVCSR